MQNTKAEKPSSRPKGINLDRARELLAVGLSPAEAARVVGCSRENLVQRIAVAQKRIAAAEKAGRAVTRRADTQAKSVRVQNGGQGNVRTVS
jgi:predicted DNA-binding protein (UPF0251 family)